MPLRHELLKGKMTKTAAIGEINRRWNAGFLPDAPTLLVFGGSLGAASVNRSGRVSAGLPDGAAVQVIHLTGPGKMEELRQYYAALPNRTLLLESSPEMHLFYSAADLIFCRAGGSTVSELAYFGKYAVVVPYPFAAENHQFDNARWLASSGGARILPDAECSLETFNDLLRDFLENPGKYREAEKQLASIAIPDASRRILDMMENIVSAARAGEGKRHA